MENKGLIRIVNYLISGWQFSGVKSMGTKEYALDEVGEPSIMANDKDF